MGSVALLAVVAVVAASGGYFAAATRNRRARVPFIAGFCCGLVASGLLRGRRGPIGALRAASAAAAHLWAGSRSSHRLARLRI